MHKTRLLALLAMMLARPVQSAHAQYAIDQRNDSATITYLFATDWDGQTFKPTANTSAGAGIKLTNAAAGGPNGSLKAVLWTGIPGASGATQIATGDALFPAALSNFGTAYVDVFWYNTVSVTPGATYFLSWKAFGPAMTLHADLSAGTAYGNGQAYLASSYFAVPVGGYSGYANYDFNFEEFSGVLAPEPSTVLLVATGLGALALHRRRRNV